MAEEYARDPRSAWLPKEDLVKRINLNTAIKNLSAAISDREYQRFCETHRTKSERRGDRDVAVWANPEAAMAFDTPKKEQLRDLYRKYWRLLPVAKGYPADAPLNLGLMPPTVPQFRIMLENEAKIHGYVAA